MLFKKFFLFLYLFVREQPRRGREADPLLNKEPGCGTHPRTLGSGGRYPTYVELGFMAGGRGVKYLCGRGNSGQVVRRNWEKEFEDSREKWMSRYHIFPRPWFATFKIAKDCIFQKCPPNSLTSLGNEYNFLIWLLEIRQTLFWIYRLFWFSEFKYWVL